MVRKFVSLAFAFCLVSSVAAVAQNDVKVTAEVAKSGCSIASKAVSAVKCGASAVKNTTSAIVQSVYSWALGNRVLTASAIAAVVAYAVYFDEINEKIKSLVSDDARCGCNKPKPKEVA